MIKEQNGLLVVMPDEPPPQPIPVWEVGESHESKADIWDVTNQIKVGTIQGFYILSDASPEEVAQVVCDWWNGKGRARRKQR